MVLKACGRFDKILNFETFFVKTECDNKDLCKGFIFNKRNFKSYISFEFVFENGAFF
jgi:hypothetical protein